MSLESHILNIYSVRVSEGPTEGPALSHSCKGLLLGGAGGLS